MSRARPPWDEGHGRAAAPAWLRLGSHRLPWSDHLPQGRACARQSLPSAQEQAGTLPGLPSARSLPGRESLYREHCVHGVGGAPCLPPGLSVPQTQPQHFIQGWALLPTPFTLVAFLVPPLMWYLRGRGERGCIFFIQQRPACLDSWGSFPRAWQGCPPLMFQVSAQRRHPQPPRTNGSPLWPLTVAPAMPRACQRLAFRLDCPSVPLCGVFSWHTYSTGETKGKFVIDTAPFPPKQAIPVYTPASSLCDGVHFCSS